MTVQSYVSAGAEYFQSSDTTCQGVTQVINGRVIKPLIQHAEHILLNPGHPSSLAVVAWRPKHRFSALNIAQSTQRRNCGIK